MKPAKLYVPITKHVFNADYSNKPKIFVEFPKSKRPWLYSQS